MLTVTDAIIERARIVVSPEHEQFRKCSFRDCEILWELYAPIPPNPLFKSCHFRRCTFIGVQPEALLGENVIEKV